MAHLIGMFHPEALQEPSNIGIARMVRRWHETGEVYLLVINVFLSVQISMKLCSIGCIFQS